MIKCEECSREFKRKGDLTQHINMSHSEKADELKLRSAKSYIGKIPENILDLSSRTTSKILHRLKIKCCICRWDEASLDIHHIIEKRNGGSNSHDNLTLLCPNCHRLIHNNKIDKTKLKTLKETVGEEWRKAYYSHN